MGQTAREVALLSLLKMQSQGFSNLVIDAKIKAANLNERDAAFATALFYGVLERMPTLDRIIRKYSKNGLRRVDDVVLNALRLGLYQLLYMDSVEDYAAINESVELIKRLGKGKASGYANAVLRAFLRDDKQISYPPKSDVVAYLSAMYACPRDLTAYFVSAYGQQNTETMLQSFLGRPPLYIRVNTTKTTPQELVGLLTQQGAVVSAVPIEPNCLQVEGMQAIEKSEWFQKGYFHVQDLSSQLCVQALDPKECQTVLDMCAAPGGKTFTIAQQMRNTGTVYAFDLHDKRVRLIQGGARRLGLTNVKACQNDAGVFNPSIPKAQRVLCDAPCSGYGVISKKPEIKYKTLQSVAPLCQIQYNLLDISSNYVSEGGRLVYSTCTLNKQENEEIAQRFLREHPGFQKGSLPPSLANLPLAEENMVTILPGQMNSDGFFIAVFEKVVSI